MNMEGEQREASAIEAIVQATKPHAGASRVMAAALLVAIKAGKIPGVVAESEASKDWRSIVVELEDRIAALRKTATLRDRFASDAMAAMLTLLDGSTDPVEEYKTIPVEAYILADAMMAERDRTNG